MENKILLLALIAYILCIPSGYLFVKAFEISTHTTAITTATVSTSTFSIEYIALNLIVGMLISIVIILLFGKYIIKYYGFLLLFIASFLFLIVVSTIYSEQSIIPAILGALAIIASFYVFRTKFFNIYSIFIVAVMGGYLGFFNSPTVILIYFIILSVYDVIAVFRSNFMMNLVGLAIKNRTPLFIHTGNLDDLAKKVDQNKQRKKKSQQPIKINAQLLGGGDLLLGGALAASVAIYINIMAGLMLVVAAMFGLILNYEISGRRKIGLPALPILLACQMSVLGVLLDSSIITFLSALALIGGSVMFIDGLAQWKVEKIKKLMKNGQQN